MKKKKNKKSLANHIADKYETTLANGLMIDSALKNTEIAMSLLARSLIDTNLDKSEKTVELYKRTTKYVNDLRDLGQIYIDEIIKD